MKLAEKLALASEVLSKAAERNVAVAELHLVRSCGFTIDVVNQKVELLMNNGLIMFWKPQ